MLTLGMPVGELLEALEDDLGAEAVWKLTGAYGGRCLHIPQSGTAQRSVVIDRVGEEIAAWLYNRLGHGGTLIPMGPHSRSARNIAAFRTAFLKKQVTPSNRQRDELPRSHRWAHGGAVA